MKMFQLSEKSRRCGSGKFSNGIFRALDLGGRFRVTITFSKDGHAIIFVQYESETHTDWSIPIFSP